MNAIDAIMTRPLTPEQAMQFQRDYQRAIEPIVRLKVSVYNLTLPDIVVTKETAEVRYQFTADQKRFLEQCDECIAQIGQSMAKRRF